MIYVYLLFMKMKTLILWDCGRIIEKKLLDFFKINFTDKVNYVRLLNSFYFGGIGAMATRISFFPVGNGDMTLIETERGHKILIDVNIRSAADDPDDDTLDVASRLRDKLSRDTEGRLYVDVLLVSHPDEDHCRGLLKHFHLGSPDKWSKSKDNIFINKIWSSPMVFRRASKKHHLYLCDDAKAFNAEAKRRVQRFRENSLMGDGDKILILGEDENGKTDDLQDILVRVDQEFPCFKDEKDLSITARLLAPLSSGDDDDNEVLSKNNSSTVLHFSFSVDKIHDKCQFLTGGDAEVVIWKKLWKKHRHRKDWLSYDILLSPHHCSWHSLSYDSWSELGNNAKICDDARSALSQARDGAVIVASSKPVKNDNNDPPCIRAKHEYEDIVKGVVGTFRCTDEYPSKQCPDLMEFEIGEHGPSLTTALMKAPTVLGSGSIGRQPLSHG